MAAEKIEVRFMVPSELACALDAIAMAHDLERNALVIKLLVNDVHQILRKSSLIQRTMRGNPLLAESDGKPAEWSAL